MKLTKAFFNNSNYPRPLSSIIISVGLLAGFVTFTSWVLLSYPIGTSVRSYFNGAVEIQDFGSLVVWQNVTPVDANNNEKTFSPIKDNSESQKSKDDGIVVQIQPSTERNTDLAKELNHSVRLGNGNVPESDAQANEKENVLDKDRTTDDVKEANRSISLSNGTVSKSDARVDEKEDVLDKDRSTDDNNQVNRSISLGNETIPESDANQGDKKEHLVDDFQPLPKSTFDISLGNESNKESMKSGSMIHLDLCTQTTHALSSVK